MVSPQRNGEEGDGESETKLKSLFEIIPVLPFQNVLVFGNLNILAGCPCESNVLASSRRCYDVRCL